MYIWGGKARNVPDGPGVYALYDDQKALIYIGKSANLREDFADLLKSNFSNNPRLRETRYYKREFTPRMEDRAKELLEEYRRTHGKLPECNLQPESVGVNVTLESGFHFYEDIGKMIHESALNLADFRECVGRVSVKSLEFHQRRGDFANWIRDVLRNERLAEAIEKIDNTGEGLRRELLNLLNSPEKAVCPECGARTSPSKVWKMAGRPSKTGERLQLTIGYFKCHACNKSFRHVLKKEKIQAS